MQALVIPKSVPRYLLTRVLSGRFPRLALGPTSLLSLKNVPEPELPRPDWVKLRTILSGICGSDLAVVKSKHSLYLTGFTSFPFVPGHEVVAEIIETGDEVQGFKVGDRVVVEPALGCVVRGIANPCSACAAGRYANCLRNTEGAVAAGLQTGYCRSLPGGWGERLVAHVSQLYPVPADFSDRSAVLVEPFSCAIHGVLRAPSHHSGPVLVVGCGVIGLLTIAALKSLRPADRIVAVAKHPYQASNARALGADAVCSPGVNGYEQLASEVGAKLLPVTREKPAVVGGFPVVYECVGSSAALDDAVRWSEENGTVVALGMPSDAGTDLTPLWHQQVRLAGAFAYGLERTSNEEIKTFDLAIRLMNDPELRDRLSALVTHEFPIRRYKDAILASGRAGRLDGVKVAFSFPG